MPKKDFIPHQIHLSTPQIRKLGSGLSTNLKHSQMGADKGDFVVMLHPQNARKMLTSFKNSKGMRLSLSPEEIEMTEKHGTGFFKSLKKFTGINKTDFLKTAKSAGKHLVEKGAEAVGTAVGAYTGNPQMGAVLSKALAKAGDKAVDSIQPSSSKYGISFDPSESVSSLKQDAKEYGLNVLEGQLDKLPSSLQSVARDAISSQMGGTGLKGSKQMREKMARLRAMRGSKGGKVNIGKAFRDLGRKISHDVINPAKKALTSPEAMKTYKQIAHYGVADVLPAVSTGVSMLLGDPTGLSGATTGKILADQIQQHTGAGIRRGRGRPRKGGGIASMSSPYKRVMKNKYGLEMAELSDNRPVSNFSINPRVSSSSPEMTLSPYARLDSPAMNPFIPTHYSQEGGQTCGYGGRGLYAGGLY